MVNFRAFSISDDLFSGFMRPVDLDNVDNIEEVIKIVVDDLKMVFDNNNFVILKETVEKRNFHIQLKIIMSILILIFIRLFLQIY